MLERIRERYMKNYIRDDQLARYVVLGVITEEQAETLKAERYGIPAEVLGGDLIAITPAGVTYPG